MARGYRVWLWSITALLLASGLAAGVWVRHAVRRIREADERLKFNQELLAWLSRTIGLPRMPRAFRPWELVDIQSLHRHISAGPPVIHSGDFAAAGMAG